MNRPLPKTYQIVGITMRWRRDWQRSLRSERNIVAGLGVDTGDHPHSAIENSQKGSQSMKDRQKMSMIMRLFWWLTLLPSMLLLRINEGVENAKNRLYK